MRRRRREELRATVIAGTVAGDIAIARAIIKPERARINRAAALPARLRDGLHCITAAHGRHGIDQHGIYLSRPQSGLGRRRNEHGDFAAWRLGRKMRAQIIKRAAFDFFEFLGQFARHTNFASAVNRRNIVQ